MRTEHIVLYCALGPVLNRLSYLQQKIKSNQILRH